MAKRAKYKKRTFEGLPVIDATKALDIHITPNDVKRSTAKDPANCAAARAGQRQLGTEVRVFLTRTYVKEKNHWVRFMTPESVSREIVSFDRGSQFQPGEYSIPAPSKNQRLGVHRGVSTKPMTGNHVPKVKHMTGLIRGRSTYDKATANLVKKRKKS